MRLIPIAFAAFLLTYSISWAAEVRADRYGERFNKAADVLGATVRLGPPSCNERECVYGGDRGVSAEVVFFDSPKRIVDDSVFKIPISFTEIEVAAILQSLLAAFVPETPQGGRDVFALSLARQLAADKVRAEGRLGKWVFVLRHDPRERWRVIVRKPGQ